MRKPVLTILVLVVVFASGFGLGIWYGKGKPAPTAAPVARDTSRPPMTHPGSTPTQAEWQELRMTRDKTLQNDPALAAEYHALLEQIAAQEHDIQSAMIKVDPKVEPLLTRLAAIRRPAPNPAATGPKPPTAHD